ncbi:MAG TPA: hypothetical protein VGV93_08185 [Acidimicrobiales bacterium]|nr:hypothetical protein [Acidimicrobiales bacterium]
MIVVVAAAIVTGVGMGGSPFWSGSQPSPSEVIAEAGPNTLRAGSSRISVELEVADAADASDPSGYRIEGVMDYRRNFGRFIVDVGRLGVPVTVPTVEMVKGLSALYVRLPEAGSSPRSERWLVVTSQELSEWRGLDSLDETLAAAVYAAVTGLGAMNEMLQAPLEDLATDIADSGKESLRGEETHRYNLTLDSNLMTASILPELGGTVEAGTADVWVDGRGRARQIRWSFDVSLTHDGLSSRAARATQTMEFSDFGVPVEVEEPPAEDVVSLAEFSTQPSY